MKIKEEKEPTLQIWAPLFSIIWCLSQFSGGAQAESSTLGRSRLLVLIDSSFDVLGTHMESQGNAPSWQSVHTTPHEAGLVCTSHPSKRNGGPLGAHGQEITKQELNLVSRALKPKEPSL